MRIEGPPRELHRLRRELRDELGSEVDVQPVTTAVPGELREPILVAIEFVASSAVTVRAICAVIERYMGHLERKEEFRIYREDREISLEELREDEPAQ